MKKYFEDIGVLPRESGSLITTYALGFFFSLVLTIIPLTLIELHDLSHHTFLSHPFLREVAIGCALIQFFVQLIYFLHLGGKHASRERQAALLAAGVVVLILVGGSLWIMFTLNTRMMPNTAQMEQYMNNQQGI